MATTKGIDSALVGDLMMQVENRFGPNGKPSKPIEWLTDNGSCYTAAETRSFAKQLGLKPVTTPVTSPQSNGMAVQGKTSGKLNIPAVLGYGVKTTRVFTRLTCIHFT